MKKIMLYIIPVLLLLSCVKKTEWSLKPQNTDLIVVDGIIVDTMGAQMIKITHPVNQLNETPQPVSGVKIVPPPL